jgi:hypothetical protein
MQDQMRFEMKMVIGLILTADFPSNHTGKYKNMVNGHSQYSHQLVH